MYQLLHSADHLSLKAQMRPLVSQTVLFTALRLLQSSTHGVTLTLQHQPSEHVLTQACLAAPSLGAIAEHEQIAAHPGSPPSRAYSPFPATSGITPILQAFLVVL